MPRTNWRYMSDTGLPYHQAGRSTIFRNRGSNDQPDSGLATPDTTGLSMRPLAGPWPEIERSHASCDRGYLRGLDAIRPHTMREIDSQTSAGAILQSLHVKSISTLSVVTHFVMHGAREAVDDWLCWAVRHEQQIVAIEIADSAEPNLATDLARMLVETVCRTIACDHGRSRLQSSWSSRLNQQNEVHDFCSSAH